MFKGLMSSFNKSRQICRSFPCWTLSLKHLSPWLEEADGTVRTSFCSVMWEARMFCSEEISVISQILCLAEVHLCVLHY